MPKIEIDVEAQKELMRGIIRRLKKAAHEIDCHKALLLDLQQSGMLQSDLNERLNLIRESSAIKQLSEDRFAVMEAMIERLDEVSQDQALEKLLEQWKPIGEPN